MSPTTEISDNYGCTHLDSCLCGTCHPLERDGTSQAQRLLKALDPSYVAVDERSLEDLLAYSVEYAGLLNYYDYSNTAVNDWKGFLERDISVMIALASKEDISAYRDAFKTKYNALAESPDITKLEELCEPFITILNKLSSWYNASDERTLFHTELNIFFQSIFLEGYVRLAGIALGAEQTVPPFTTHFAGLDALSVNEEWQALIDAETITANTAAFEGNTPEKQLTSAAGLLKLVFEKYTSTLQLIIDRCPVYLEKSIEEFPYHKPHTGLFLTFLHLFEYAQNYINGITERHLDYFYTEVLKLAQKEAVADKVHIIFELAKSVTEPFKVPADTLVKAGKDATGKALFYGTDDDIIVNRAKAVKFQNLFVDYASDGSVQGLFASPVANSSDGKGGELDKTVPQWAAFGSTQQGTAEENLTMPEARVGFAIASQQLLLSEGKRVINVILTLQEPISLSNSGITAAMFTNAENYTISYTSEKKWITLEPGTITVNPVAGPGSTYSGIRFEITLTENLPAVTAYSSKIHAGTFNSTAPVLTVVLPNFETATGQWKNLYAVYKKAVVSKIEINLNVTGMKNISLHNDFAKIDPTKPFQPFGQLPVIGSTFYAGSEEIFFKSLKTLDFNITWLSPPENFNSYYTNYNYSGSGITVPSNTTFVADGQLLENKKWGFGPGNAYSTTLSNKPLFASFTQSGSPATTLTSAKDPIKLSFNFGSGTGRASSDDIFDPLIKDATRGFIKLSLDGSDFLQDRFPLALAYHALTDKTNFPLPPYIPVVKSFSVDFTSSQVLDTDNDQFFHLQPFGEQTIDELPESGDTDSYRYLFPQFVRINDLNEDGEENAEALFDPETNETLHERNAQQAMLFIALENLDPQQSVSLLVQVVENSGNPKVETPEINWAYLRSNEWVQLSRQQVFSDTTNGFLTSGIVELDIPEDATNDNTILASGYHWLRASIDFDPDGETNPSAVCDVLSIQAQAIQASFRDAGNDPNHLASPLAASTITKLDSPLPEVKSVSQPYSSFGGKVKEEGNDYYRRVSERLRHKGRAITMWDYERLVLEYFPSIYKVKCISHTIDVTEKPECYLEIAPGNVCVVVVSNLRNLNQVNPLKPSTSINTRKEIKEFLGKRASGFSRITVIDPAYQSIQVRSKVKYLDKYDKDKGYYDKVLIEDIKKFLSPWAYDEGADIVFGGKIHASYIINFIEEREYVDYLTDFTMYMLDANGVALPAAEMLAAENAKSILVSADTHLINPEN